MDSPKSRSEQLYTAPRGPLPNEVGGSKTDESKDRTPDLNNHADKPGQINIRK